MSQIMVPYGVSEDYIVEVVCEGPVTLQTKADKLKQAIKEMQDMLNFGMVPLEQRVMRNTKQVVKQDNKYYHIFEVL